MSPTALLSRDKHATPLMQALLKAGGHDVRTHTSASSLLLGMRRDHPAAVIFDRDLPRVDWQPLLDRRQAWLQPALAVIAVGTPTPAALAQALEAGADDFVAKPSLQMELLPRLLAALRRRDASAPRAAQQACAGCVLDVDSGSLRAGTNREALTAREMAVAQLLFSQMGQVVSRSRIATEVWGCDDELADRSIGQHVYQLRRKLARCAGKAMSLSSVYGSGYRLEGRTVATVDGSSVQASPVPACAPLLQTEFLHAVQA